MVLLNSYQSLDPLHKVVRLGDYMLKEDSLSLLDISIYQMSGNFERRGE